MYQRAKGVPMPAAVSMLLALVVLAACGGADVQREFTFVGEEREVHGTVVDTELIACSTVPDQPGTCEGSMVLETAGKEEEAGPLTLEVTRDVVLTIGDEQTFLPSLQGRSVTARYFDTEEGDRVVTSVDVVP